jgi:hypothetical protein
VQESAEEADESAPVHEEGNQQKKPIDEELTKNLFGLVGFGYEILMLLKFNVGLVCLVLFEIFYNVSML